MENVLSFKQKPLMKLIEEELGNDFIISFMDGEECHTFVNDDISDIKLCYMIDTLNERRGIINANKRNF